ncbi:MAG: HAD family hydrolase [Clostridia bacterium]|nr:HAD family hydrolase [Clostridia bacterium]
MVITGAIFDMDGTLLNSMDYWGTASSEYLTNLGLEPFHDCDKHFLEDGMVVWYETAVREHGLTQSFQEVCDGIYAIMDRHYSSSVVLKDGVLDMLNRLRDKGVKMCLATATNREQVERILNRLGIAHFFSGIFTVKEVGVGKRKPLIYQMANEFLGTDPSTTYVFEDAFYAITTCHDNGIKVVGVYDKNIYLPKEKIASLCDYYLDENDRYYFEIE